MYKHKCIINLLIMVIQIADAFLLSQIGHKLIIDNNFSDYNLPFLFQVPFEDKNLHQMKAHLMKV